MQTHLTTPFGRRPLSLAMVATQIATSEFAGQPSATDAVVHKWRLFRSLTEAKKMLGVTDRALSVLHALLTFHPETALALARNAGAPLVVFPSNKELSIRAHGMAPSTLRRHLAFLVDAGLVIRRDSPNGKRFARRRQDKIEAAFGFDLSPLVARAAEIERLAEEVRAEDRAIALLRERISLMRRDIVKMIVIGLEEAISADWEGLHGQYLSVAGRYARSLSRADLDALADELAVLAEQIGTLLETRAKEGNISANDASNERHIQNQTTDSHDIDFGLREGRPQRPEPGGSDPGAARAERSDPSRVHGRAAGEKRAAPRADSLPMTLAACPDIVDYAKGGEIGNWAEFRAAAAIVRPALGISPDAWAHALDVLGERDASIVVAAILQRGDEIKSAGGYLRVLTAKAEQGDFSVGPVLMTLLRRRASKSAACREASG
ncbi:replication initiation protein RepC [Methylosinus sp. H3A]|uniref:plasmid replication protein RepC n=1 Tax=Methylosinus sp. H3A TaxID=2785786 RepID=UPI0018C3339C|nr:plasmid replication protein RepC [Methylosinus sp. H3A]MBG0808145.1 replication initiation protein RepC [Methylosinus sp. H3A]